MILVESLIVIQGILGNEILFGETGIGAGCVLARSIETVGDVAGYVVGDIAFRRLVALVEVERTGAR